MNLKKMFLTVIVASALVVAGIVNACELSYYVGADFSVNLPTFLVNCNDANTSRTINDNKVVINKKSSGVGLVFGSKICNYCQAEVGYEHFLRVTGKNITGNVVTANVDKLYFDALGYMFMTEKVDFIGVLGFGHIKNKVVVVNEKFNRNCKINKIITSLRFGVGLQCKLNDVFDIRFVALSQDGEQSFDYRNVSFSLGTYCYI